VISRPYLGRFFHAITFGLFFLQVADVSIILSASFGGFLDYHKQHRHGCLEVLEIHIEDAHQRVHDMLPDFPELPIKPLQQTLDDGV
jgi:hypothetical protein